MHVNTIFWSLCGHNWVNLQQVDSSSPGIPDSWAATSQGEWEGGCLKGRSEDLQANDFDGQCQILPDYPIEVRNPKLGAQGIDCLGLLVFSKSWAKVKMPAPISVPLVSTQAKVWTACPVAQRRHRVEFLHSEYHIAGSVGWGWLFQDSSFPQEPTVMRAELCTSSGQRQAASAICSLIFPVAFPILCPFKFPIKTCSNAKISLTITASQDISPLVLRTAWTSIWVGSGCDTPLLPGFSLSPHDLLGTSHLVRQLILWLGKNLTWTL